MVLWEAWADIGALSGLVFLQLVERAVGAPGREGKALPACERQHVGMRTVRVAHILHPAAAAESSVGDRRHGVEDGAAEGRFATELRGGLPHCRVIAHRGLGTRYGTAGPPAKLPVS